MRTPRHTRATIGFLVVVVVVAGASGLALLAWPGSTDRYFSWTLGPRGAAALIGTFYVASSVVFGWALWLPWRQVRPLFVAVLGLAVPTLVLSLVHDEVFDFGRWQAWAWFGLFAFAPVSALAILATSRDDGAPARRLSGWSRAVLGLLTSALSALAVLTWLDPTRDDVSDASPVGLVGLTGAYLGAWCSFLAVLCAWPAIRGRADDVRLPVGALVVFAGGAAVASLRTAVG